ncbi:pyridoxamine 5'-phosphate oxidase family protein [Streptomyces parvulus]|uniref:TIGR03668 family PPOX class F420-dependent oxidoreductase n=1 Tax=Streptomyces parvulus TaxID=146923 RepID=A0A369UVP2_9ACTN|nr:pyridoxamine 5'-phosphate oxidase family protein [Streptomyces parvulus]RDD84581.1 TIGR03668 family PPOX class F420-dependent oxidoreductase [Streptomyces parvulus]
MKLAPHDMRSRLERERSVRLGTVDESGGAHMVPVIFVVDGDVFYSPTDRPKNGAPRPKRLRNLDRDPRVTVLADLYDDDWLKAWWVRLRGTARIIGEGPERTRALGLLDGKYPQFDGPRYLTDGGPVLAVDIKDWLGWAFSDQPAPAPSPALRRRPWHRRWRRSG